MFKGWNIYRVLGALRVGGLVADTCWLTLKSPAAKRGS